MDIFQSNDLATPHNPFFKDDKIVVSYYLDGVQIFDYSNKFQVERVAYYDTYPDDTSYLDWGAYKGCWGVYPFLPSERILGSDRTYGLHVLNVDYNAITSKQNIVKIKRTSLFPNPNIDDNLNLISDFKIKEFYIFDNLGKVIKQESNLNKSIIKIDTENLINGNYLIAVYYSDGNLETIKFNK